MRRGSLEFVAASPVGRRLIALEKLAGHAVALAAAMTVVAGTMWLLGVAFRTFPTDAIEPAAAFAYAGSLGLQALAAGSVAMALAAFLGRGAGAGIASALLFAGYVVHGYRTTVPAFEPFANLTWFSWTANHLPLAGRYDWQGLVPVLLVVVVGLAVAVEAFARRDLRLVSYVRLPGLPRVVLGLHGPVGRSFADQIGSVPDLVKVIRQLFPGVDITTPGGFLQLVFTEFGLVLAGLAAAVWTGSAMAGGDAVTPAIGTLALGAYAAALAGIGFAIGGLVRASIAGPVVAVFAIGTFLLDLLAPALNLPDWVHQLALSGHLGAPMVGTWDAYGTGTCLALAVIGLVLGGWGLRRRDVGR